MDQEKQPTKEAPKSPRSRLKSLEEFLRPLSADARTPGAAPATSSKSDEEAIAAAMEAMQRLAMETDVADSANAASSEHPACASCGNVNPPGNRFCAACGTALPVKAARTAGALPDAQARDAADLPAGPHNYHHHYHHHYFSYGESAAPGPGATVEPRTAASLPARAPVRERAAGGPLSRAEVAVRKVAQDWAAGCNTKHLDDLVSLYTADAIVLRPNVPPVRGTAAIHEYFFSVLEAGLGEVEMEPIRIEVVGDIAYQAGRCQMLVPVNMNRRREERGKYLIVLAKHEGDWKILSDCWSTDLSVGVVAEPAQPAATQASGSPRKSA
jgi:uncharacterized protein (TIGR02246 family)